MADNLQDQSAASPKPEMPQYPPRTRRRGSSNWWIPIVIIGAIFILFIIFIGAIIGSFGTLFEEKPVEVKSESVLYLDLADGLPENPTASPFAMFGGSVKKPSFFQVLNAIEKAKDDDNIEGIFYNAAPVGIGKAKLDELQKALLSFKESGKFIYSFILAGSEQHYYTALVSDSIFMPKEGMLEMNGFGSTSLFFDKFFEKLGIEYHVEGFKDFKSAGEMFNRTGYSDSSRYQTQVLLNQRHRKFVESVTRLRQYDKTRLEEILAEGVYTAIELKDLGLIDGIATEMQVRKFIKAKVNREDYSFEYSPEDDTLENEETKLNLISLASYVAGAPKSEGEIFDEDSRIALITAQGAIQTGHKGGDNPFAASDGIYSGDLVKYIKAAREDDNIKAIILRIDSPGGSVIASEEIWDEIMRTKLVKPVYSSMSSVAASGGYYISAPCDTIIASPETITGSIGVILAIPNFAGTLDKLGVFADTVTTSHAANFLNVFYPFDEHSLTKLHKITEGIYDRFIEKVATGRNMDMDRVYELAKGRVWTGEDAYERGLVDVLGGLDAAIDIAKARMGVPKGKKVYIEVYPKPEDELQALLKAFGLGNKDEDLQINLAKTLGIDPISLATSFDAIPDLLKDDLRYALQISAMAKKEQALVAMPYNLHIK